MRQSYKFLETLYITSFQGSLSDVILAQWFTSWDSGCCVSTLFWTSMRQLKSDPDLNFFCSCREDNQVLNSWITILDIFSKLKIFFSPPKFSPIYSMLFPLQKPSQARVLNYAQPSNRKTKRGERHFPDTLTLCSYETGLRSKSYRTFCTFSPSLPWVKPPN